MTTFAATSEPPRLIEKAQLHGLVTVVLCRADLEHVTRAGLHNRHGDAKPRFVINLRHPDLAAEYSLRHRRSPYRDYSWSSCVAGWRDLSLALPAMLPVDNKRLELVPYRVDAF